MSTKKVARPRKLLRPAGLAPRQKTKALDALLVADVEVKDIHAQARRMVGAALRAITTAQGLVTRECEHNFMLVVDDYTGLVGSVNNAETWIARARKAVSK